VTRRDPVDMIQEIAEHFLAQAQEIDDRLADAIARDASSADIIALRNMAATDRLRALSACQAAAPFVRPRLQAIELAPASPLTQSRFEARLAAMSEEEVLDDLKRIAAGTLTLAAIDDADAEDHADE
jgi:hypothetical protein